MATKLKKTPNSRLAPLLREFAPFDAVAESVFAWDKSGRIIFWNRRAAGQYGWSKGEALGKFAGKLLRTIYPVSFPALWKTLLRHRKWQGRLNHTARDGWPVKVDTNLLLRCDPQGRPAAVLQKDNELIEANWAAGKSANKGDRFSCLGAYSPLGIFLVNPEGNCTHTDQRCQSMCGCTYQESQGKAWPRFVLPTYRKAVMKEWISIAANGGEYSKVFRLLRRGEARWVQVRSAPLFSDHGKVHEHIGTVEDITERLQAQEALEASEAFNRRVLASSPDCVKVLDPQGRLLFINLVGQQLLEIDDLKSVLHSRWTQFWRVQDRPLAKRALLDASRGGEGRFEGFRPTMTGVPKWWDVKVTGIFDGDGKLLHLLIISRDITERKAVADELTSAKNELRSYAAQLEAKVRERTQKLIVANQKQKILSARLVEAQESERRQIARELHDEIGQQLTGLKLLMEHYTEAPVKPSVASWAEGQDIIVNLIKQIQELALDLRPQVVDRLGLKVGLQWYLKRYQIRTGINVRFNCQRYLEEKVPAELKMTGFRLVQEALTNVARHAGVKAAVVQISNPNRHLSIFISDRGRGFDRTIVLQKMTTGLSVMDERVAMAGGTLTLNTVPGKGTQVLVELPLNAYAHHRSGR